jgi:nucleotidyltransferase substrate binding protein (TIGR01987 family)
MSRELELQLALFKKALVALEAALAEDDGDVKSRNSVLLSYVFTFEMAWKSLKKALLDRGIEVADYAVAVLRAGFQAGLISDPVVWDALRNHRNDVTHAYDEQKAIVIAAYVHEKACPQFAQLLARLQQDV